MTEHSLWRFSRAFHRAINERQREDLEALIDDEIDWAIYGPIDMFPFFGARHGKAAVLEVIRQIADNVRVHRFDREGRRDGGLDVALFADHAGCEQAGEPAGRAFRAVQGRPAGQAPRPGRYLRSRRTGARASHPSAEDRLAASASGQSGAKPSLPATKMHEASPELDRWVRWNRGHNPAFNVGVWRRVL